MFNLLTQRLPFVLVMGLGSKELKSASQYCVKNLIWMFFNVQWVTGGNTLRTKMHLRILSSSYFAPMSFALR